MSNLYYAGAEASSHRTLLQSVDAPHVAISFVGLTRRVKRLEKWTLESKFRDEKIFLDSGTYSVNQPNSKFSLEELKDLAASYQRYVAANIDRVSLVSEFDALPLGADWLEQDRLNFYDDLPRDKFMPIWHYEYGIDELNRLAEKYTNIGITSTTLSGRNLAPLLNQISNSGVNLHGVGITSVDDLYSIRWSSVSSTAWISPQSNGDTILWTGRVLKRYPKAQKDQARKKYRTYFENNGFDSTKIEEDDYNELLRLSVWSWEKLMQDVSKKQGDANLVTTLDETTNLTFVEDTGEVVDTPREKVRNSVATTTSRATRTIPVLGVTSTVDQVLREDGETEEVERLSYGVRSESTRVCKSCFLSSKCPAFDETSNCAFNIPIEIKTRDQFTSMQNSLVEMQAQRVLFMRFAEETEGGYADPNLSVEMDRLQKMLKTKHDMESDTFSFKVEATASGEAAKSGMLSRLFGDQASNAVRALPEPVNADKAILDAEVVQDWQQI